LAEGLTFIRTNRILSELVVVGISIHFAEAAAYALFAPYSEITLQANSATYGFMLAMISAGTAGGSVLVGKLDVGRHMGKMLLLGIFGTGIGFTILGQVSTPGIALAISFAVGVFAALVALPIQVLLQSIVPGRLLGRVTTSLVALFSASQPLGSIVAGTISNSLTPATGLSLLGIFTAVSIFLMSFWFKDLRYSGF
jgi:MFS family permease